MTDIVDETRRRIRRSLGLEFVRMEDDFDETRDLRRSLTNKLVQAASGVNIVNADGVVTDDTPAAVQVMNTALKALEQTEKASVNAITMKLRHQEAEAATAAAHQDRLTVVLQATRPGRIMEKLHSPESLEDALIEMIPADEIKDFEMKSNPNDLSD